MLQLRALATALAREGVFGQEEMEKRERKSCTRVGRSGGLVGLIGGGEGGGRSGGLVGLTGRGGGKVVLGVGWQD